MNTPRAGQGKATPTKFAFALSLLILFVGLVGYGALLQLVEQTREPSVRLKHISEYSDANRNQDAFQNALYFEYTDDGCE